MDKVLFNLLKDIDSGVMHVEKYESDFSAPQYWNVQTYVKFLLVAELSGQKFAISYHEKSSPPDGLRPGHYADGFLSYKGTSLGHPRCYLAQTKERESEAFFERNAQKLRVFFLTLTHGFERQFFDNVLINMAILSKLPWGGSSATHHLSAPPEITEQDLHKFTL